MRTITSLSAVALLALNALPAPSSKASELPSGTWRLSLCEGTASTGSTCAFLDETLKLEVKYAVGATDIGKVLFSAQISHESAQQAFGYALSAVQSFGQTTAGTGGPDGNFFMLRLEVNGHVASVDYTRMSAADDAGPAMRSLAELLSRITHVF
jgi:hypothetical protein